MLPGEHSLIAAQRKLDGDMQRLQDGGKSPNMLRLVSFAKYWNWES